jgi:hypothetical protein
VAGETATFNYDALDRLTSAGGPVSETYTYSTATGNLASKAGMGAYTYQDSTHKHAVTHLGGVQKYWYDANGNMITRIMGASTYNLTYDAENRLTGVSGEASATFVYRCNGKSRTGEKSCENAG